MYITDRMMTRYTLNKVVFTRTRHCLAPVRYRFSKTMQLQENDKNLAAHWRKVVLSRLYMQPLGRRDIGHHVTRHRYITLQRSYNNCILRNVAVCQRLLRYFLGHKRTQCCYLVLSRL